MTTAILITLCICELILQIVTLIKVSNQSPTPAPTPTPTPTPTEHPGFVYSVSPEELKRQREKYEAENEAFQQMLNYNADVAYGVVQSTTENK